MIDLFVTFVLSTAIVAAHRTVEGLPASTGLAPLVDPGVDPLDDRWESAAIFTRPITALAQPGLDIRDGADGLDAFRAIAGAIDGVPFVFRAYPGDPNDTVQLYFERAADRPEHVHDLATLHRLTARIMEAYGIHAADLAWKTGDHVPDEQAFIRDLRERQGG
jgi:hypothetical protein